MTEQLSADDWISQGIKALAKSGFTALKADPLKLVHDEEDSHPNSLGVHAMAKAMVAMLLEHPASAPLLKPARTAGNLGN